MKNEGNNAINGNIPISIFGIDKDKANPSNIARTNNNNTRITNSYKKLST
jgi:hypothetical protein